jgi:uncharacterized glyoxalase superfamily protein PhnB
MADIMKEDMPIPANPDELDSYIGRGFGVRMGNKQLKRALLASPRSFSSMILRRAIAYYCDNLGFQLDFEYQSFSASVTLDGFPIYLKLSPKLAADREHCKQNEHLDAYISVSGIADLFSELQTRGAHIITPLEERPWACRDFYVQDPDGYISLLQ